MFYISKTLKTIKCFLIQSIKIFYCYDNFIFIRTLENNKNNKIFFYIQNNVL